MHKSSPIKSVARAGPSDSITHGQGRAAGSTVRYAESQFLDFGDAKNMAVLVLKLLLFGLSGPISGYRVFGALISTYRTVTDYDGL